MAISNILYSFFNKMSGGSGGGDGEINTGTNIGDSGVGVYDSKLGTELRFRKINPASSKLTVIRNTDKIDIDISDENLDILSSQITDSNTPLGVVLLNAVGKIDSSFLPASAGELTFQGSWNANTNSPDLWTNRDSYSNGYFWIVSEAGSTEVDGESDWEVGDLIFKVDGSGKEFEKIDQTDKVLSVNGETGIVEVYPSAGFLTCSGAIDNGDGTITVVNEDVVLYSTNDFTGNPKKYTLSGGTFGCPAEETSYLVGDYNSGSPIFKLITDVELITESDVVPFVTLYRNGSDMIHIIDWDCMANGLINKLHQRLVKTDRFARESGIIIDTDDSKHLSISSGKFWYGGVRKDFNSYDSTTDTLRIYYHSGGSWTYDDTSTELENFYFDNGTDLEELSTLQYVNNWIFVCGEGGDSIAYVVLGDEQRRLSNALEETIPTLPEFLNSYGILVGRITYRKNETPAERIDSAFMTSFVSGVPTDHSDLNGLTSENVHPASSISVDNTDFDNILSSSDDDIQSALETLDDHTHSFSYLDDTSITSVTDGQMITWNDANSKWINSDPAEGGVLYIDDLWDVNVPSEPDDFDFLVWNPLKNQWENSFGYSDKIHVNPMAFTDILNNPSLTTSQDAFSILDTHGHPASDITDLNTAIDNRIDLSILNDLSDVNADSPSNEQLLSWDSSSSKWIPRTVTDNDTDNLNDLTDTNLTTPAEGDILKYNSSSEWENQKDTKTLAITLGSKDTDLDLISSYPIYAPFSGTIKRVIGVVNTAPTGADLIIDINIDGTSIWNSTQANRLTISASSSSGTQTSFDTTSVTEGDVITIDIDQIGSTIAGQDLTVQIEINKS